VGESTEFAVLVDAASEERVVVRVCGELDMATTADLEAVLASAPRAPRLVIDLSECTFLDSAGVRAITMNIRERDEVSIVTSDPGIRRVLEITALDSMVAVRSTLDDAV
jgi:anti-anti-sigma factor